MSFGGFGSQGTIRYALIVDDAQANAKIGTFKQSLTSLAPATQQVNSQMGALSNNFKGISGGLTSQNTLIGQSITQHKSLGTQIKTNIGNFSNLAIGLSATATSALSLAAGFRDYNDAQIAVERVTRKLSLAQESLTKAQDKLNALQTKGVKSGKEYEQAQLDVQQAEQAVSIQTQLLGESQERLFDSQSQFVVSIVPTVLGAVGSLGAAFQTFGGKMGGITDTLGKMKGSLLGTTEGFSGLKGGLVGILGPAGLAAAAALLIIDRLEGVKQKLKEAGVQVTQTSKSFIQAFVDMDLAKFNSEMKQSMLEFDNVNKIMKTTPWHLATTDVQTLRKEITAAGGVFDKSGKLMEVQKERVIDLGAGFQATSVQYIKWSENWIRQGLSKEQVMKKLTDSTIKQTDAEKIYNFALADSKKPLEDATKGTQELTKSMASLSPEVQKVNDLLVEQNIVLVNSNAAKARAKAASLFPELEKERASLLEEAKALGRTDAELAKFTHTQNESSLQMQQNNNILKGNNAMLKEAADQVLAIQNAYKNLHLPISETTKDINAWMTTMGKTVTGSGPTLETMNEILKDLPDSEKIWGAQIIKNNADLQKRATALKKAQDATAAWQKTVDEFAKTKIDVASIFGFDKKFDSDKVFKQMVEDLPKSLEKRLKGTIKANFKIEETEAGVKKFIESVFVPIKDMPGQYVINANIMADEKDAIAFGKDVLNKIKKIPDADTKAAGKQLADAIAKGDMTGINNAILAVMKTLDADKVPPIPVKIVAIDLDASKFGGAAKMGAHAGSAFANAFKTGGTPKVSIPIQGVITQISSTYQTTNPQGETVTVTPGSEEEKLLKSKGGGGGFDVSQIQTVQKALQSLATYGIKNLQALAKAAKTNFDTVANYAAGATTSIQTDQKAIQSLVTYGTKNLASLGKASKTNFDTVANYSAGATGSVQTLQKAIDSMTKYGIKNIAALAKSAKTNFNSVANYADGATSSLKDLAKAFIATAAAAKKAASAIRSVPSGGLASAQHGMHQQLSEDTLIMAHKGERVDIGPGHQQTSSSSSSGSFAGNGDIVIHTHVYNNDRETLRTQRRKMGENFYRFGPS